jgi:50S ribosomal subunit-associated GTPase HflX
MTPKMSNAALGEKIDALKEHVNTRFDQLKEDMREVKTENKQNTEFRQKAHGIVAFVGFVSAVFGGVVLWLASKLKGGNLP